MAPSRRREESTSANSLLVTRVAQMHFVDRLTNLAIAERLGISRFRVARLIDLAVESGAVTIQIAAPAAVDTELSARLRERWSLTEALVLEATSPTAGVDETDRQCAVCRLAARFLRDYLVDGGSLGVSWGTTLDGVVAELETMTPLPICDVVQLEGNPSTLEHSTYAGDALRRFAGVLGGAVHALHAPLVVPSVEGAAAISSERSVARTLAMARNVDIALVDIGSWAHESSHLMDTLPAEEIKAILPQEPVTDVCARVLDKEGRELDPSLAARTIAASLEDLRAVRLTIGVAAGSRKAEAVRTVLRAGVLDALIVDAEAARVCLEDGPEAPAG